MRVTSTSRSTTPANWPSEVSTGVAGHVALVVQYWSRLRTHDQNMTVAAMQIADMKV